MKKIAALAALASLLAAPSFAQDCRFSAERSAEANSGPVKKVVIAAGAGDLVIRGEAGRAGVTAHGHACASTKALLDQIRLESRQEGDTVYVETLLPDATMQLLSFSKHAYLDLTIAVPASASLSVEDSSGDLELSKVQSAIVTDSSGDQTLRDVTGDLEVTDSSGELSIARVGGTLHIDDSSGDIDVHEVRGDVVVSSDSSGDLEIEQVAGSVRVVDDSSGDIEIRDVQRDVTVEDDSSGSIRVDRVGGDFTVGADGSGSITHNRVLGSVRIPEQD